MASLCDEIEQFILETMNEDQTIRISRNGLAEHFGCAPSQINYVLRTRFNVERGYLVESKRGGGGSVSIVRLSEEKDSYLTDLIHNTIGAEIPFSKCERILKRLLEERCISDREYAMIAGVLSDKALLYAGKYRDQQRAEMFKEIILTLLRFSEEA